MIFLIDIGNTRTKYVHCREESATAKFSAVSQLTNINFSKSYFTEYFSQATEVIAANVGSATLTDELQIWCDKQNIKFTQVFSEKQKDNVVSAYLQPSKLGIDRWLALLASAQLYPNQNILIIDAGTATTVDLLLENGQHQGGWILAGIDTLRDSLLNNSTLVTADKQASADISFGNNTSDNVHNACWAASLGMIQQAVIQAEQLNKIDRIILTGGNGKALLSLLLMQTNTDITQISNIQYIEKLVFYGLHAYS